MKYLLLCTSILISINTFASREEGGWSSSGGGEFIVTKNNPWFMGKEKVKWCIDFGGEDKFSLSKEKSKIEIETAIAHITKQIDSINKHSGNYSKENGGNGSFSRKCGLYQNDEGQWSETCHSESPTDDDLFISTNYTFVESCENADLEVILGNYKNPKIEKMIQEIGVTRFKNIAGFAMRTEYSERTLRAKGFIYIASDKGELQYSGPRNITYQFPTIWDHHEKLNPKAPFVTQETIMQTFFENRIDSLKLKENTIGALRPIFTHEFVHINGQKHTSYTGLMHEDYPSKIIQRGLEYKGNFTRSSQIFSKGLIEQDADVQIGFEWNYNRYKFTYLSDLYESSPLIFNFMFDKDYDVNDPFDDKDLTFILKLSSHNREIHKAEIDKNGQYKVKKKYTLEIGDFCPLPDPVEEIQIRLYSKDSYRTTYVFNEETNSWAEEEASTIETVQTIPLMKLMNTHFCGRIYFKKLFKEKYLSFKITNQYFNNHSQMEITDPESGFTFRTWLTKSDILNIGKEIPFPRPQVHTWE